MKDFNYWLQYVINEDVENDTLNSDKEVKLKDYQEKISKYNSDKGKFKSILSKDLKVWEQEAQKIIDGNVYLGGAWKLTKMQNQLDTQEEKIKSGDLTQEEIKEIQDKIKKQVVELNKEKQELNKKIKDDLTNIQKD